ncbi:MAG: guanylate kinase [Anaerolineae bacterium]
MTSHTYQGTLFVLVGPGGVGKNAILKTVLERVDNLGQLATATTRAARIGEQHGKQRLFVSHTEFRRMIRDDELAEHTEVHTGDFYGVPRTSIENPIAQGQDLIADIDMHGANTLRNAYPNNIVLVFIAPPGDTLEEMLLVLKERLETRDATAEQAQQRLLRAPDEMAFAPQCDYLIINDNLDKAVEHLYGIILAERSRKTLLTLRAKHGLHPHQFSYAATVIPVYQDEVLYHRNGKHFPTGKILVGELPHEAALRLISKTFGIHAEASKLLRSRYSDMDSRFVQPLLLEHEEKQSTELVVFDFIYLLHERISAHNWEWVSVGEIESPIASALAELNTLRSNN